MIIARREVETFMQLGPPLENMISAKCYLKFNHQELVCCRIGVYTCNKYVFGLCCYF